jgi:hypothetical protein
MFVFFFFFNTCFAETSPQILNNCSLKVVEDQKILHLKGSPYEIGYQHGNLLKNEISNNIARFITPILSSNTNLPPVIPHFKEAVPKILPYISLDLVQEMQGMADGSGLPYTSILFLNLFPEMFHCSGVIVKDAATLHGELYHVRVLDYSKGNGLQSTAILTIVEPNNGIPFLNATYAGFVGCVTGMNLQKIAIGEIGGKGYGYWEGVPMAFLLRTILQHASTLEDVKSILTDTQRTCEYYYVFSDGKTKKSFGCYATPTILTFFAPGETYCKLPPLKNTFDPLLLTPENLLGEDMQFKQPQDILMIAKDEHYDILKNRLLSSYGHIGLEDLKKAIKTPIAHLGNLHNAIFAPETLDLWISHAGKSNEPACDQPYHHFNLQTLIGESCQSH